ncbi:MAG TPA: ATP-binding protein [Syntrophorhabdaceae bacterium]|nr:ATP-binding protein [Syntrophorhabdaceae bacterium]HOD76566.1 ATP-binding protein [Syntrophorhabdaceae bacterium]
MTRAKEDDTRRDAVKGPAERSFMPEFVGFVRGMALECCYSDKTVDDLGQAIEEAVSNIIRFACREKPGEIEISCTVHDTGALYITIADTGAPFNMLLAGTFPEADDFFGSGERPSTKIMKRAAKNIEYKRSSNRNILIFTVSHDPGGMRR